MDWIKILFPFINTEIHPTELHYACGDEGGIEKLLEVLKKNPDLEAKDAQGKTALFWAIESGRFDCFELLLKSGANPNAQDKDGVTCLNLAKSSNGLGDFVEVLLKYNADPTIKDKHGKLYLM